MSRLADYFVIVGYDNDKEKTAGNVCGQAICGKIVQRFPEKDWPDTPFIEGIEWFCQPLGWNLSYEKQEPKFFISVLTDIDANKHYCACLSFHETLAITQTRSSVDDEDETTIGGSNRLLGGAVNASSVEAAASVSTVAVGGAPITHHSVMYAPKCLVLISRLDCADTFKNCLGTIYTVYIENLPYALENLVGNILGCIQVPPAGGPQVRFSIGAGDKQSLQPPQSSSLPTTGSGVHFLFKQLGIKNVLILLCAVMTENKILFHSKCYWHLTDSCKALVALMYPFRYTHVYIPILPAPLTEVLSTPTPFIMGIHSSLQSEITDLLDVIVVDLDGGLVTIPESLTPPVPMFPSPLWEQTQELLAMILFPNLAQADLAFPSQHPPVSKTQTEAHIDKELRAIFMRLFAQLLQGYRSCLTIIRIHPKTVITFHKAGFLGARDLIESEFLYRVLDSMFFTTFVNERGPPWRAADAWDELYSSMNELLKSEAQNKNLILTHIQELGRTLFENEGTGHSGYAQKVLRPPEGSFQRIHQPAFPRINSEKVELIIQDGIRKNGLSAQRFHVTRNQHRIIPMGPRLPEALDVRPNAVHNSVRRLEVLRTCVAYIFENRIADARKLLPAVMRTLKHRDARLILCRELFGYVYGNKAVLDHQQFELVIRFMNKALQNSSGIDEYTVAAALLPMSTIFCRKLSTGVVQFAYTEIQDHAIWKNLQFWESTFYQDVQAQIKALYLLQQQQRRRQTESKKEANCILDEVPLEEPTALEITAEQLRKSPTIEEDKKNELSKSEESTLYSQAIHFANRMVSLLIPLDVNVDASSKPKPAFRLEENQSVSNSIMGSHSLSEHSDEGFEENDALEIGVTVGKTISRFIDCVCTEGGVTSEHIRNLHDMVPGVVHMHIESLEPVYLEAKRHPHVQKPKIQTPCLLPGEELVTEHLRCFLMADGREDDTQCLIPAEGALFLTNYRIVFKGSPCDPLFCEQTIVRAFPIASLLKEKKISVLYLAHLDQTLPEGLQLRSSSFQLLKLAFDTEVTPEQIESFRKTLGKARHPFDEFEYFAFQSYGTMLQGVAPLKTKEKYSTLKGFAKKTLLRTAKRAGFKQKQTTKRKLVADYDMGSADALETHSLDDELEDADEFETQNETLPRLLSSKDIERMRERSYVQDWKRLGFDAESQRGFRISNANANYALCRSYPAIIVAPVQCSDATMTHLGRYFKGQRIPLPTWRHQNGALLIRGAQPNSKSVIGMLKNTTGANTMTHHHHHHLHHPHDVSHYHEQDKYFMALINTMPKMALNQYSGLNLSMSSLLGHGEDHHAHHHHHHAQQPMTPEVTRKHEGKSSTMKGTSAAPLGFRKMRLYALGEKSQAKSNLNGDFCADFIPVDYPDIRQSRSAFKKLIRACMPSHIANDADGQSFAKMVEQSDWLQQISSLLQLAGAVVDLIDLQESSVMLSLEDGSDVTAQLSAIAQLCLDPYYRRLDGFRVLVEKEWLAFGHRFAHRSNLKPSHASTNIAFAPTFLQFLDVVHQLQRQFPMAFEFNDFYLRFLAYHVVSCRFRTFLFDCELERSDSGISAMEDKRGSLSTKQMFGGGSGGGGGAGGAGSDDECNIYPLDMRSPRNPTPLNRIGHSIFDYIERQHSKTAIFYNFLYSSEQDSHVQVLRPQHSLAALDLWSYYTNEELAQGPPYDLEVTNVDDEIDLSEMKGKRMMITAGYDNIEKCNPNAYVCLLSEVKQAETERGHLSQKWQQVWNQLEVPLNPDSSMSSLSRKTSLNSMLIQQTHKRSTLEIIMKGRLAGYQDKFFHPHRFEKHPYTTPTNCNHCTKLLWGPVGYRCMDCGNSYHEKCTELSMKNCTKYKAIDGSVGGPPNVNMSQGGDTASIASSAATSAARTSSHHFYNQFSSNVAENRTHEGHLYKRGALLKGWKQRWFVLDSIKHQLRYYDTSEDTQPKGIIELAEVQSVTAAQPAQIGTKRVDEKGFFDLKTSKRTYNFYAVNAIFAQEWIEKLQACLQ
ncbi:uncharacterized protein Dwil_GK14310 [Drosophila willistoni]|uniref:Myotubularin-related protein 13 n=1 Tax=Drosophila willistoni TaxID=7260 RepID=B4NIH7_DROWI|nr:myotubularin-related protein 13 [Drosophila willistoni]EDW84800.1 uncharacterized protein Dwil_GK14310 [Drosophila willistoni]